jgi:hypothetical protein
MSVTIESGRLTVRASITSFQAVLTAAGSGNNASTVLAEAWAARASMVYGNTYAGA